MLSEDFIKLVRCPVTRAPVSLADEPLLVRLRKAITAKQLRNRVGQAVERLPDGGLVNQDHSLLYPIFNDIPDLIADDAIPLSQLDA